MTYVFQKNNYEFNNHELIFLQGKQLVSFPLGDPWSTSDIYLRLDYIRNHFYKGTKDSRVQKFIKNIMIVDQHGGNTTIQLFYGDTEKEEGSTNSIKLSLPTLTLCKKSSPYAIGEKTVLSMFENERDKLSRDERILYGKRAPKRQTTENALRF